MSDIKNIPDGWVETTLKELAFINPRESLPKGTIATNIPMDCIDSFSKKIQRYNLNAFKGGTKFRNGDTLLARITPCLENGKTAFVDILNEDEIGFGSTEYIVIREKKDISDRHFLFYLSISPRIREVAIKAMTGTSGRQRVQTDMLVNHKFILPSLPEQKSIAAILTAFDDKIELLQTQNKTLEETAQTIFKEWFGKYQIGDELPEGWRVGKLGEVITLIGGGTPNTSIEEYWNGEICWYSVVDLPQDNACFVIETQKKITPLGLEKSSTKLLRKGTTIISARGTVGKLAITGFDMAMNQSCYGIQGQEGYDDYFTYFLIKDSIKKLENNVHGAIFDTITKSTFDSISLSIPTPEISLQFEKSVIPIMRKILNNVFQIQTLTQTRDALLPKLMSGQIRVNEFKD